MQLQLYKTGLRKEVTTCMVSRLLHSQVNELVPFFRGNKTSKFDKNKNLKQFILQTMTHNHNVFCPNHRKNCFNNVITKKHRWKLEKSNVQETVEGYSAIVKGVGNVENYMMIM